MNPKLYLQLSEIEDSHWWFTSRRRLIREFLPSFKSNDYINGLDIGCGTGGNLSLLKEYCDYVVGLDYSLIALNEAKRKSPKIDYIRSDANYIEDLFKPQSFSIITIFNVLHHEWINSELAIIEQCYNLLKPGGYIIITEPAFNLLKRRHDIQAMTKHRYQLGFIEKLLKDAEFNISTMTYFNTISFLPALLFSFINFVSKNNQNDQNDYVSELKYTNSFISILIERYFLIEIKLIKLLKKIPIGVNILCIAQKPFRKTLLSMVENSQSSRESKGLRKNKLVCLRS